MSIDWTGANPLLQAFQSSVASASSDLQAAGQRKVQEDQIAAQRQSAAESAAVEYAKMQSGQTMGLAQLQQKTAHEAGMLQNEQNKTYLDAIKNQGDLAIRSQEAGIKQQQADISQQEANIKGAQLGNETQEQQNKNIAAQQGQVDWQRQNMEKNLLMKAGQDGGIDGIKNMLMQLGHGKEAQDFDVAQTNMQKTFYEGQKNFADATKTMDDYQLGVKQRELNNIAIPFMATFQQNPEAAYSAMGSQIQNYAARHPDDEAAQSLVAIFQKNPQAASQVMISMAVGGAQSLGAMAQNKDLAAGRANIFRGLYGPNNQATQQAQSMVPLESAAGKFIQDAQTLDAQGQPGMANQLIQQSQVAGAPMGINLNMGNGTQYTGQTNPQQQQFGNFGLDQKNRENSVQSLQTLNHIKGQMDSLTQAVNDPDLFTAGASLTQTRAADLAEKSGLTPEQFNDLTARKSGLISNINNLTLQAAQFYNGGKVGRGLSTQLENLKNIVGDPNASYSKFKGAYDAWKGSVDQMSQQFSSDLAGGVPGATSTSAPKVLTSTDYKKMADNYELQAEQEIAKGSESGDFSKVYELQNRAVDARKAQLSVDDKGTSIDKYRTALISAQAAGRTKDAQKIREAMQANGWL